MRSYSHLNTAKRILESYGGEMPLAAWLKQFFKAEKKFGSTDRKQIAQLCYCFYRLGNAFKQLETGERILTGIFLCSTRSQRILEELRPEWNSQISLSLSEKLAAVHGTDELTKIFPFSHELGSPVRQHEEAFHRSFLVQPDLFLRIRPGAENKIIAQLEEAGISFRQPSPHCLALDNQTRIDEWLQLDRDAVVQDASSQKVFGPLLAQNADANKWQVWDCCAASGGKSILFHDLFPEARLTVSDVRESIMTNLQNRFRRAGINGYKHFVGDISSPGNLPSQKFDLIICDAPCSGSGTWSRTPEQLNFFSGEKIAHYSSLQKKIALNAAAAGKKGAWLLYITCSVFGRENEEVVEYVVKHSSAELVSTQYFQGFEERADTLFTALFKIG